MLNSFDPVYQGSEKSKNPIITRKMKILLRGCLIAQMKRQDALITTQKTSTLCDVPLLNKSRKTPENDHLKKNGNFIRGKTNLWCFY